MGGLRHFERPKLLRAFSVTQSNVRRADEDREHRVPGVARLLILATTAAVVATLTLSGGVAAAEPVTPPTVTPIAATSTAATSTLPVCLPGQESATKAGAGTPAPLGNLQGLPESIKSGGTFADIALDAGQVEMAATIVAVGKQMGITRRGIEIGISVATEQSSLRPEAINGDWLGLFQQNPVTYTQYKRTEAGGAAWMFYDQLIKQVPGYDTDPRQDFEIGDVVQKTTTGERFAQYKDMSVELAGQLIDAVSLHQDDVTCAPAPAVATTTGSAFDPGNIISDAVFYNTSSMTVDQIRVFIRAEGESCVGAYCLKNLSITSPSQPADRYCAAYQGGTNEDVATVIAKFSTACGISPQVMLVTLQKESGLLSRTDPTASTYNAAWGWHCPDTGPGGSANCDPAYAGFFNQGYGMAKQWSRYKLDPQNYNYRAGQTVNILWNIVESGCGSAPVTIQNTATASLYIYTPYQPNAAALAAYPGTGDSCSAYGNRNFFYLFRKYFGSTGGGTSTTGGSSAVLSTGTTVTIPNNQFVSEALAGQTITAPNAAVAAGLAAGFSALGLPYVWGGGGSGAGPNNGCARGGGDFNSCGPAVGFDCSGLTAYVLGMAGYQTPGDSSSQRAAGASISWAEALPGDIVGFPGHVAVYLGTYGGRPYILEASWVGTPIHIVPLTRTDFDDRVHRYWTGPAVHAPGVADFSDIVRGYSGSPSAGSSGSGSSGSSSGSSGSPRTYVSNIPRISPMPYPAPVPQPPAPAPTPVVPETSSAPPAPTTTANPPPSSSAPAPSSSSPAGPSSSSPTGSSPTGSSPTGSSTPSSPRTSSSAASSSTSASSAAPSSSASSSSAAASSTAASSSTASSSGAANGTTITSSLPPSPASVEFVPPPGSTDPTPSDPASADVSGDPATTDPVTTDPATTDPAIPDPTTADPAISETPSTATSTSLPG